MVDKRDLKLEKVACFSTQKKEMIPRACLSLTFTGAAKGDGKVKRKVLGLLLHLSFVLLHFAFLILLTTKACD